MSDIKRLIQLLTGFDRIHSITYSYGYKIPFTKYAIFDKYGLKKAPHYHNCTKSNLY